MIEAIKGTFDTKIIIKGFATEYTRVADWVVVPETCVQGLGTTYDMLFREGKCNSKWRLN